MSGGQANTKSVEMKARVVLVTGAAAGMGRTTALAFKSRGYTVFGTSRHPEAGALDFPLVPLDVRSDTSAREAIETVRSRTGRLDVLVNNVGSRLLGAVEETSDEEARDVFETNFFGTHRVTRAALPVLREAGDARIVNVSSLVGLNAIPFGGLYSASKWALEAYSEALRYEVKSQGIHVSIVEPGPVRSGARQAPRRSEGALSAYDGARQRALEVILRGDQTGIDPGLVAECVLRVVESRSPRLRYRVGPEATWLPRLKLLRWSWYESGLRRRYALDRTD